MGEVKICGTRSMLDLEIALEAGVDAVGVICGPNARKNIVDMHRARWLMGAVPDNVTGVLLPETEDQEFLLRMIDKVEPDRVQLGASFDPQINEAVRARNTGLEIAQVIHVSSSTNPSAIDPFLSSADCIHLDSAGSRPGGNGVTHDWRISREIAGRAQAAGKRVILAGGLTSSNVAEAIDTVKPDGVDVETGIKDICGSHDPSSVSSFVKTARRAFVAMEMLQ